MRFSINVHCAHAETKVAIKINFISIFMLIKIINCLNVNISSFSLNNIQHLNLSKFLSGNLVNKKVFYLSRILVKHDRRINIK